MRSPLAFALLLATAALGGCGPDPFADERPQNSIHMFLVNEMKGFDPAFADEEISNTCCQNVYDTLYEYHHLKRPFELVPCLAEALPEVSADQKTYRIRLKKGVTYVDDPCFPGGKGREVTAYDVAFSLMRLQDARYESPGSWLVEGVLGMAEFHEATKDRPKWRGAYDEKVAGLRVLDAHTIEIELKEPQPWFRWILSMAYLSVYPPEAVGRYGADFPNHPVSSGPWLVREYAPAQRLVLERNPGYREDRYPMEGEAGDEARGRLADAGKRLPLADRVVATVFKEQQPQWLLFGQGFLDRTLIPKDNFDIAIDKGTQELQGVLRDRGVVLDKVPRVEIIYECFNQRDPVIGKPAGEKGLALRRAMSLADDQAWVSENLYNGRVRQVQGPLLAELDGFDPAFKNPWKRGPGESREQALARAKKLLADAGMPEGRGVPALVYETQEGTLDRQHFEAFSRDMRDIGLSVRPNQVTWQEMNKRIDNREAQIWGISWGADYPDAQNFLQLFYGPNAPSPNGANYEEPAYDALYQLALRTPPGPVRDDLYRQMQRMVVDDAVWNFRFRRIYYNLDQPWFHGFKYNDLYSKDFKYCRADVPQRAEATRRWNHPVWLPVGLFLGACAVLFVVTALTTRRTATSW